MNSASLIRGPNSAPCSVPSVEYQQGLGKVAGVEPERRSIPTGLPSEDALILRVVA